MPSIDDIIIHLCRPLSLFIVIGMWTDFTQHNTKCFWSKSLTLALFRAVCIGAATIDKVTGNNMSNTASYSILAFTSSTSLLFCFTVVIKAALAFTALNSWTHFTSGHTCWGSIALKDWNRLSYNLPLRYWDIYTSCLSLKVVSEIKKGENEIQMFLSGTPTHTRTHTHTHTHTHTLQLVCI